jgi:hypothetical protein
MREKDLPDAFIVALNIISISIIITNQLYSISFFNRSRISLSRLLISVAASSDIRLFSVLIFDKTYIERIEKFIRFILIKIIRTGTRVQNFTILGRIYQSYPLN